MDGIQPVIYIFDLHGSDVINIDFDIGYEFYEIEMIDNWFFIGILLMLLF